MSRDSGCFSYIHTVAQIVFPGDQIRCDLCPCLQDTGRPQCRLTGEYLMTTKTMGYNCPLDINEAFIKKEDDTDNAD